MINRVFSVQLARMLEVFPVVAVIGCRQVGKSTLVQQPEIARGRTYLTLDDLAIRSLAESDPDALLNTAERLILDEVQLAPAVLRAIKRRVDRDRQPGRYIVTGSADLNYCADLSGALAGRVGILALPPITVFETRGGEGNPLWAAMLDEAFDPADARIEAQRFEWNRLRTGGFPLSLTARSAADRALWMEAFRVNYLERDLRRISDIGHLSDFNRLLELSAARTAQLTNQAALAREVGLTTATAGRYLSILEASFLIRRLAPHFQNIGKRLVKSPKLYWRDTGLAAHLLGWNPPPGRIPGDPLTGPLFETLVMMDIDALLPLFAPQARLAFVRTHDGLEVDGWIGQGRRGVPFEIKAAQTVTPDDARPLRRWMELSGAASPRGFVLYAGDQVLPLAKNIWAIPFDATVEQGGMAS
jgi:uncharacterized protein